MKSCAVLSLACLALASCAVNTSPSGFLDDYDQLQPGKNALGARLAYVNPETDFSKYDKLIIDPITFYVPTDSVITEDDKLRLGTTLHDILNEELSKDYEIVTDPGPSTMRFRCALTELVPATRTGNVVSSVVPAGRVLSEAQYWTTGTTNFSARGTGEAEVVDSESGDRLAALSDTRWARPAATTSATRWGQIEGAMRQSAKATRKGLAALRER